MLIQMRSKIAKVFMFFLFALLILSFAVWGIEDMFRIGGQNAAVAKVGKTEVGRIAFERLFNRQMNTFRQQFGQFDINQARAFGLVDQTIQQLVTNALFEEQANELGLAVSEAQIKQEILDEPSFQNELGGFSAGRFQQILSSNNLSEQEYIRILGNDIERQLIVAALDAADAPQNLAETLYRFQQERRIAETLLVPRANLPDDVSPTEEQLQEVYEANQSVLQAPEYRAITYLALDAETLAEDITIDEAFLRDEFEVRRSEYSLPERRSLQQMVFSTEEVAKEAKQRLESGEEFAAVSQSILSRDPVDLGVMSQQDLAGQLPDVAEAVFGLELEAVSDPVQSPFGWHLLKASEIQAAHNPTFEEVQEELGRDLAMREAVDSMLALADSLDDELAGGATVESAAQSLSLQPRTLTAVDRRGLDAADTAIEDLPAGAEFLQTAFSTEIDETSLLTETRDGNYFVLRVDEITESATRPLEDVREQITEIWSNNERDRRALEKAQALADRAGEGLTLPALAVEEKYIFAQTPPLARERDQNEEASTRAIATKLFEMAQGDIEIVATPEGQMVTKLIEIQDADPTADEAAVERVRDTLGEDLREDLLLGFVATMQNDFGVEINTRVVEEATATY